MKSKRPIIYAGVALLVVVVGFVYYFHASGQSAYTFATVTRGAIVQEVLASGDVESPSAVDLYFKNSGALVALNVVVGEDVAAGDVLARQDNSSLEAQLQQAQATVAVQTALLQKLQAGPTRETIAVSQAALSVAQQSLENAYSTVPSTLASAYAKARDALSVQLAPFFSNADTTNPQLTFFVADSQLTADVPTERLTAGTAFSQWEGGAASSSLDAALDSDGAILSNVRQLLTDSLAAVSGNTGLSSSNASAYRAAASAGLSEVNAAITSVEAVQQTILADESAVQQAQASLSLASASSTSNDIEAQQALVEQASAGVAAIQAQLRDTEIVAPVSGVVTDTQGQVGSLAGPGSATVSLMPRSALEVKVNVSEDNIVGVKPGETARVELDAIPGEDLAATVTEVDPAETLVGGAVYYKTTLLFDKQDPRVKSGMTANVWIETGSASSTLLVPASAVTKENGASFVQVQENGALVLRPVSVGLQDQNGTVEVTSGLQEGNRVVTGN